MTATATTRAWIGPATMAAMLVGHVGLLDVATDDRLALAILDRLRGTNVPLGKVTTDYGAIRRVLRALTEERVADPCDPAYLEARAGESRRRWS